MLISFTLPDVNLKEDEIRLLLSIKLLDESLISLGKAAEIAGLSEQTYTEVLLKRGISPINYDDLDLSVELDNA